MKTRQGFVSNSSSSSFIIATKGKLTPEKIVKAFCIPKNSPILDLFKKIADGIVDSVDFETKSRKSLIKHMFFDKEEYLPKELKVVVEKAEKENMTMYYGLFSNEDDNSASILLSENDFNFETDEIIMSHQGGF